MFNFAKSLFDPVELGLGASDSQHPLLVKLKNKCCQE